MDSEIDRIRQARLAQLRSQGGGQPKQGGEDGESPARDEMRNSVLSQILTPEARERLNRIEMVRPERARQVQQILINMAQSGQLQNKVDENNLVGLLNQVSQHDTPQNRIVINRRSNSDDEAEDESESESKAGGAKIDDDDDDFFD